MSKMYKHWRSYKHNSISENNKQQNNSSHIEISDSSLINEKKKCSHHSSGLDVSIKLIDDLELKSISNTKNKYYVRLAYIASDHDVMRQERLLETDVKDKFEYFIKVKLVSLLHSLKQDTGYDVSEININDLENIIDLCFKQYLEKAKLHMDFHNECMKDPLLCYFGKIQDTFPTFILSCSVIISAEEKIITIKNQLSVMYYNMKIKAMQFNEEEILSENTLNLFSGWTL